MTAHHVMYGHNVIQVPLKQPETNVGVNLILSQLEFDIMILHVPHYEQVPPEELLEQITRLVSEPKYHRLGTNDSFSSNKHADSLAASQNRLVEPEGERKRLHDKQNDAKAVQDSLTEENAALREQWAPTEQQKVDLEKVVHENELLRYQTLRLQREVVKYKTMAMRITQELKQLQHQVAALKNEVQSEYHDLTTTVQDVMTRIKQEVQRRELAVHQSYGTKTSEQQVFLEKENALPRRIRVFCRFRPYHEPQRDVKSPAIVIPRPQKVVFPPSTKEFTFDHVFGPECTQQEVYEQIVPLLASYMNGDTVCILAYGQPGSEQPAALIKPEDNPKVNHLPATAGLLPRALQHVFDVMATRQLTYQDSFRLKMGRIDPEQLLDLMCTGSFKPATELTAHAVTTYGQVHAVLHRHLTALEIDGTRKPSHALLILELSSQHRQTRKVRTSTLCFVDFARSNHRVPPLGIGDRCQSLAALQHVVNALEQRATATQSRSAKRPAAGQVQTLVLLQVSPDHVDVDDTTRILEVGTRVRQVDMTGTHAPPTRHAVARFPALRQHPATTWGATAPSPPPSIAKALPPGKSSRGYYQRACKPPSSSTQRQAAPLAVPTAPPSRRPSSKKSTRRAISATFTMSARRALASSHTGLAWH